MKSRTAPPGFTTMSAWGYNVSKFARSAVCHIFPLMDGLSTTSQPPFSHELITDSFAKLKEMQVMVSACNNR